MRQMLRSHCVPLTVLFKEVSVAETKGGRIDQIKGSQRDVATKAWIRS